MTASSSFVTSSLQLPDHFVADVWKTTLLSGAFPSPVPNSSVSSVPCAFASCVVSLPRGDGGGPELSSHVSAGNVSPGSVVPCSVLSVWRLVHAGKVCVQNFLSLDSALFRAQQSQAKLQDKRRCLCRRLPRLSHPLRDTPGARRPPPRLSLASRTLHGSGQRRVVRARRPPWTSIDQPVAKFAPAPC